MDAAHIIRESVATVTDLRHSAAVDRDLAAAVSAVKHYQSRRFQHTYRDLLAGGPYQAAARFFLDELYGDVDYSKRDAQFARIAGALQRVLPKQAIATAVSLARLHALTEDMDHQMGRAWASLASQSCQAQRYAVAWRMIGGQGKRALQLEQVLGIGMDLAKLTRTPGLRLVLKMMRGPAQAAGLPDLQHFLEKGFDTFAAIGKTKDGADGFLKLIQARETELIAVLFDPGFNTQQAISNKVLPPTAQPGDS
jgi:hypothetical protein